jgi:hypothetical protein
VEKRILKPPSDNCCRGNAKRLAGEIETLGSSGAWKLSNEALQRSSPTLRLLELLPGQRMTGLQLPQWGVPERALSDGLAWVRADLQGLCDIEADGNRRSDPRQ